MLTFVTVIILVYCVLYIVAVIVSYYWLKWAALKDNNEWDYVWVLADALTSIFFPIVFAFLYALIAWLVRVANRTSKPPKWL